MPMTAWIYLMPRWSSVDFRAEPEESLMKSQLFEQISIQRIHPKVHHLRWQEIEIGGAVIVQEN